MDLRCELPTHHKESSQTTVGLQFTKPSLHVTSKSLWSPLLLSHCCWDQFPAGVLRQSTSSHTWCLELPAMGLPYLHGRGPATNSYVFTHSQPGSMGVLTPARAVHEPHMSHWPKSFPALGKLIWNV